MRTQSSVDSARKPPEDAYLITALETLAANGVPPIDHLEAFDIGTTPFLDVIERELVDALVSHGAATCRFVVGPYGAGKTHLLRLMRERALTRGMVVLSADLVAGMNIDTWDMLTRFILERMQLRADSEIVTGLPAILAVLGKRPIDMERVRAMPAPHASFRNAMLLGLQPDEVPEFAGPWLQRYLEGQRITPGKLRQAGVQSVKDPLSARNAEHVLNTVLMTLYAMGVPGTLLAFDESETALQLTRSTAGLKIHRAANLMRRLIDACPTGRVFGALVVFAVLPDFIERSTAAYPALGQRLQTRMTEDALPWRSPVLRIDDIGTANEPHEFLSAMVDRLATLVGEARGTEPDSLRKDLEREGLDVLNAHAGAGYRRPLMKRLAAVTLGRMEDA